MAFDVVTRRLFVMFLTFTIKWKLSVSSSMGITVDFVGGQQGITVITVDEDSGSVSLLVTAYEDASFRAYSETFSSARAGEDFTIDDENYTLSTAETILVFINITDDNIVEAREYISITFESNVTSLLQYFIFIRDNDRLSVSFFRDVYTTSESKPANICVSIIEGSIQRPQPISLTLMTSPGSASPFEDYVPIRHVLSFTAFDETGTIICTNIPTIPDSANTPVVENTEDYLVIYEPNTEIEMLDPSNMTVYITDENGASVSVFNPLSSSPEFQVNESDLDTIIRVYVRLSPPENVTLTLQRSVDVYISTSLGTADDSDFVSISNDLITIQSNSTLASYDIMILGDIIPEIVDEQFTFNITTVNPADQVVPPSQGTIIIIDDDEVPDCSTPSDPGINGQVNFTATIYQAEAVYDCDLGYDLIGGAATRVCLLNGTWDGEDPICQIVDCGNLTSPLQGYVSIAESTFGSIANYSCFEGYEIEGNTTRTCLENGNWSGNDPTCNLVDCGDLSSPPYGNVTLNSTLYQSLAVYYCSYGYELIGNSSRYCQANGQWSGEEPICEIVDCGLLVAPVSGEVNITDTTFGSFANYFCQRGYNINGTSMRVCEDTGLWSDSMPQCIPIDCGDLPAPRNGQVKIDNGTVYPAGEATYECDGGYELVGTGSRFCLFNGSWSGGDPICRLLRCGNLPDPPNGQVSTNNPPINGTVANYVCNSGFQLLGAAMRLCQGTQWSGSPPQCIPVDCGNLTDPQNGTVTVFSTLFQSVAEYTCDLGFVLNGNSSRSCLSDGIWSASQPLCQAVDCGELRDPTGGSVTLTVGTIFESTAAYTCNNGFILIGNLRRTCQANGQWSGSEPACTSDPTVTIANSNSDFVVIVVCASVGGFALTVLITIIVILATIACIWRRRQETYSLATFSVTRRSHNQRLSQLVSPLHPGVFIPRRGLDHPLYDSVFANTGSSPELHDETTTETRLTRVHHPAIMIESSSHEDIVHIADDILSQESPSTCDNQTAQLHVSSNVIYDNQSALRYHDLEQNVLSSDHTASTNTSLPDNASFIFYDK